MMKKIKGCEKRMNKTKFVGVGIAAFMILAAFTIILPEQVSADDYPYGQGPQGDAVRIYNYVRCVRGGLSDNQAPEKPETPDGPSSGNAGTEYTYSTSTSDPDGDQVYYWFDWDDGTNSGWIGPKESGDEISATHKWSRPDNYKIRVKAKTSPIRCPFIISSKNIPIK